jgi:hypothetical protein
MSHVYLLGKGVRLCVNQFGPGVAARAIQLSTVPITGSGKSNIAFQLMAAPSSSDTVERTDLDNHEFAQYILQEHGTYFPKWARADMAILGNTHNDHADSRI